MGGWTSKLNGVFVELPREARLNNGKHTIDVKHTNLQDIDVNGCLNLSEIQRKSHQYHDNAGADSVLHYDGLLHQGDCGESPIENKYLGDGDVWTHCFIIPKDIKPYKGGGGAWNNDGVEDINKCSISFNAVLDCNDYYSNGECSEGCKKCLTSSPEACTSCIDRHVLLDNEGHGYGSCHHESSVNVEEGVSNNGDNDKIIVNILLLMLFIYLLFLVIELRCIRV